MNRIWNKHMNWRILNFECSCCVFRDFVGTPFLYILFTQINVRSIKKCILSNFTRFVCFWLCERNFWFFFPLCWMDWGCFSRFLSSIGTKIFMQVSLLRFTQMRPAPVGLPKLFLKFSLSYRKRKNDKQMENSFHIYRHIVE